MNNNSEMKYVYLRRRILAVVVLALVISLIIWGLVSVVGCAASPSETKSDIADTSFAQDIAQEPETPPEPDVKKPALTITCQDSPQMVVGTQKLGIVSKCGDDDLHLIASVTKIISAAVLFDSVNNDVAKLQDETITVDPDDFASTDTVLSQGGTVIYLAIGEEFSTYDATAAMLLASANNVADLVMKHHFGSLPKFKEAAQAYLKKIGLTERDIVLGNDASGLDNLTLVKPSALFKIGQQIAANPQLIQITQMQSYPFGLETIYNVNELVEVGYSGIKTGFTGDAGKTILTSKKASNVDDTIISLTLGDQNVANGFAFMDAQNITNSLDALLTPEYY
jgi:D-alanyl-D-alanine carboxypeptidase (penicillin-binding protein 5/6)